MVILTNVVYKNSIMMNYYMIIIQASDEIKKDGIIYGWNNFLYINVVVAWRMLENLQKTWQPLEIVYFTQVFQPGLLRIHIRVFSSNPDQVFVMGSDPDPIWTTKVSFLAVFVNQSNNTLLKYQLYWLACRKKKINLIIYKLCTLGSGFFFEGRIWFFSKVKYIWAHF